MASRRTAIERAMGGIIFASRWLQAPLYLGLIVAQAVYIYHFGLEVVEMIRHIGSMSENDFLIIVLALIDVVMISNLLIMVIIGGYETFVSRLEVHGHRDEPDWLDHIDANAMKIKLALALIGISSVKLLETFIDIEKLSTRDIVAQVGIHLTFVVSALLVAYTTRVARHSGHDH